MQMNEGGSATPEGFQTGEQVEPVTITLQQLKERSDSDLWLRGQDSRLCQVWASNAMQVLMHNL
jgi:hypothetical protein